MGFLLDSCDELQFPDVSKIMSLSGGQQDIWYRAGVMKESFSKTQLGPDGLLHLFSPRVNISADNNVDSGSCYYMKITNYTSMKQSAAVFLNVTIYLKFPRYQAVECAECIKDVKL